MPRPLARKAPSAVPLAFDLWASWRTYAIVAGIRLDVFTHIANGKRSTAEVAQAADASVRGMRGLLDALVAMGYLRKAGEKYSLTPVSATYLVRSSQLFMEGASEIAEFLAEDWTALPDAVKSGGPVMRNRTAEQMLEFWPLLVKQIFPMNFAASTVAAKDLSAKERKRIGRILDIGAGSGAWSIGFAKAIPASRVTVVDLPVVVPVTREYAQRFGVADRYEYREGDYHSVDFGRDSYDLAILGHILHGEGEQRSKQLLRRVNDALVPGGTLLIAELVPNGDRSGPPLALLFGLNMLLHTPDGDVFTMREYREWLKQAGFSKVKAVRNPNAPSPLIYATK